MSFDQTIEEAYRGFGLSSHIDTSELRLLYYGRPDIYITFTDDGDVDTAHDDIPDSFISYDIRDVVGRKVQSSEFYAYVYRIDKSRGKWMDDVRRYRREDFHSDMEALKAMEWVEDFDDIVRQVGMDTRLRHDFERLWAVSKHVAMSLSERNYRLVWARVLRSVGYIGFSDPSRSGMLGRREVMSVFLDYDNREDLDILPIQKFREDPRRRVEWQVERYRRRMRGARNRVARRRDTSKRIF